MSWRQYPCSVRRLATESRPIVPIAESTEVTRAGKAGFFKKRVQWVLLGFIQTQLRKENSGFGFYCLCLSLGIMVMGYGCVISLIPVTWRHRRARHDALLDAAAARPGTNLTPNPQRLRRRSAHLRSLSPFPRAQLSLALLLSLPLSNHKHSGSEEGGGTVPSSKFVCQDRGQLTALATWPMAHG